MSGWRKRTIMEMAREAWAEAGEGWVVDAWFDDRSKAFEAFAKLVREDEREACARVCDEYDVAEDVNSCDTAEGIAIAIRAKGQA